MTGGVAFSQAPAGEDTTAVNKLLDESKAMFGDDPNGAIRLARQAHELSVKLQYEKGEATALKNIGVGYFYQQMYVEALDHWNQSLAIFEKLNDETGISNLMNNIGAVYMDKGDDARALEYCLGGLKLAEKTNDKMRLLSSLINIGSIYHNKHDPRAINYLMRALPLSKEAGNAEAHSVLLGNIGEVYYDQKNDTKALPFFQEAIATDKTSGSAAFAYIGIGKIYLRRDAYGPALQNLQKALQISQKVGDKMQQLRALKGIANVHYQQQDYARALDFYMQAKSLGEEVSANVELKDLYAEIATTYSDLADYQNAFLYKAKYADIKDTLYNLETAKKLGRLQFDFDLYKKEGEIKLLTKEKKLGEVELQRQRQAQTALVLGLCLLVIIAFIMYRGYRNKARTNKVLDRQKAEIQNLLSNILPVEIAQELKTAGTAAPRSYERVSVLFSDFKNFSVIAEKTSPEEIVRDLNTCFVAFDNIIEKNQLEKIKTIGDSYMCAGGIPTADISHPFRIVLAGLEMQEFMQQFNQQREGEGLSPIEMRIGIHVGPVVAGVVGRKKYAYDIWGSTVNIASRMESNGAPGKVNISAATYELVKEKYICMHRGKLHAKNVGDIDMYFVQGEISLPVEQSTVQKPTTAMDESVLAEG